MQTHQWEATSVNLEPIENLEPYLFVLRTTPSMKFKKHVWVAVMSSGITGNQIVDQRELQPDHGLSASKHSEVSHLRVLIALPLNKPWLLDLFQDPSYSIMYKLLIFQRNGDLVVKRIRFNLERPLKSERSPGHLGLAGALQTSEPKRHSSLFVAGLGAPDGPPSSPGAAKAELGAGSPGTLLCWCWRLVKS